MEKILEIIKQIFELDDVNKITISKVEDSKVEIFEGDKYVGRYIYDKSKKCISQ